ncbi:hypothetical protein JDV09_15330 [Mycobacterium sp. Y57]|uniref:hypothetical protein n=1 Tax=Mycolicibacterium xanthum TaxID=2796469 RepID=UPI001C845EE3|nr:hypothetical protein [Mycolicibacterium xanthum]MBX7433472.1 hypothetical protein [Mycolicibacterium xanthum]
MSDPTTMRIFCDDPKHARGKIAEIDTLTRIEDGEWITNEQLIAKGRPRQHGWRAANQPWGGFRHAYECRLCGTRLSCSPKRLNGMLDGFAQHGYQQVTLRALVLLASTPRC